MSRLQTRAEIDLTAASENFNLIRARLGKAKLCCVVKANAYGHGAVQLARLYERLGADFLAVSSIREAMQLRRGRIGLPILILGDTDPLCVDLLARENLSQCVYSETYGKALLAAAKMQGVRVKIHIKLDTGMGRIGFDCRGNTEPSSALDAAVMLCKDGTLIPEGIFTHLSSASDGTVGGTFTEEQIARFGTALAYFHAHGVEFSIRHIANSAALTSYPQSMFDMVRVGILLYGHASADFSVPLPLRPVLKLRTSVVQVKTVQKGEFVGYGRTFLAERDTTVATVPIGYADGLMRDNGKNGGVMEICGQIAPIIGGVCMDQCMLDVSEIEGVKPGDTVTVYGISGQTSVEMVAARCATVPYEILCSIGERVPRIYLENGQIVEIVDRLECE